MIIFAIVVVVVVLVGFGIKFQLDYEDRKTDLANEARRRTESESALQPADVQVCIASEFFAVVYEPGGTSGTNAMPAGQNLFQVFKKNEVVDRYTGKSELRTYVAGNLTFSAERQVILNEVRILITNDTLERFFLREGQSVDQAFQSATERLFAAGGGQVIGLSSAYPKLSGTYSTRVPDSWQETDVLQVNVRINSGARVVPEYEPGYTPYQSPVNFPGVCVQAAPPPAQKSPSPESQPAAAVSAPLQRADCAINFADPASDPDGISEFRLVPIGCDGDQQLLGRLTFQNQIHQSITITKVYLQVTNLSLHNRAVDASGKELAVVTQWFDLSHRPIVLPTSGAEESRDFVLGISTASNWLASDDLRVQAHIRQGCRGAGDPVDCCWITAVQGAR